MKLQRNATSGIKLATAQSLAEGAVRSNRVFGCKIDGGAKGCGLDLLTSKMAVKI